MDPFLPGGVPYEPRQTPAAVQPKQPTDQETEQELQLLSNHVDELGIVTVTLWKPAMDFDLRLQVDRVTGIGLILDIKDTPLSSQFWSGTLLSSGMKVLSINGCDCSEWLVDEAMLLLSSAVGEVTITAAHSQVLYFPTAEVEGSHEQALTSYDNGADDHATNISNTELQLQQISAERVAAPAAAALSYTDTQPQIPNTTRKTKKPQKQPIVVNAVIQKPSKRTPLGLTIIDEPTGGQDGKTVPAIANIEGLCATSNTPLKVGMQIRSVNGLQCYTKEDTLVKMKRAKATVYIQAVELPNDHYDNDDNDNNNHLESQQSQPAEEIAQNDNKTVAARSLSPIKNWWSSKTSKNRSRSPSAGGNGGRLEPPTNTDGEMT